MFDCAGADVLLGTFLDASFGYGVFLSRSGGGLGSGVTRW